MNTRQGKAPQRDQGLIVHVRREKVRKVALAQYCQANGPSLPCMDQYLFMALSQLKFRDTLRDTESYLSSDVAVGTVSNHQGGGEDAHAALKKLGQAR